MRVLTSTDVTLCKATWFTNFQLGREDDGVVVGATLPTSCSAASTSPVLCAGIQEDLSRSSPVQIRSRKWYSRLQVVATAHLTSAALQSKTVRMFSLLLNNARGSSCLPRAKQAT